MGVNSGPDSVIEGLIYAIDAGNLSINLMLENANCRNSNFTEPTKPITADERIPKPNMNEYNFKFSVN